MEAAAGEAVMADEEFGLELADGEGEEPSGEALAELAALAETEAAALAERARAEEGRAAAAGAGAAGEPDGALAASLGAALAEARAALEAERAALREAVGRYRVAVLAAEPALPPELVTGESIEAVDASIDAARRAVARIREQVAKEARESRGFPAGSPAREEFSSEGMSAAEKIVAGLARFERG